MRSADGLRRRSGNSKNVPKAQQGDIPEIIPPEILLQGYAQGVFPMAESRHDPDINWYTARRRGVIPLDSFRISGKARRIIRKKEYRWSVNEDFTGVMEGCADRDTTWISDRIIRSFKGLHDLGYAHSVEIYQGDRLTAGVYGVALQAAFFAESMFQRESEMGKVALHHCHQCLLTGGFRLWDVQFYTPHLAQFGCVEIDSGDYRHALAEALKHPARFGG